VGKERENAHRRTRGRKGKGKRLDVRPNILLTSKQLRKKKNVEMFKKGLDMGLWLLATSFSP